MREELCREIIQNLMTISNPSKEDVHNIKIKAAGLYAHVSKDPSVPSNAELILHLDSYEKKKLLPLLQRKRVRTISGVSVIAVMTKPWSCPQENPCAYCPGGPLMGVPQSYTGREPAAMRGIQNEFNPYQQVRNRITQLKAIGHTVDKLELIVMGGTFPSMPLAYQKHFIKRCLEAIIGNKSRDFNITKRLAETSPVRNVGITVETRPDWAKETQTDQMLAMGVTRVELGVQNVYDDIYKWVERGHSVADVTDATQILKDAGLKIVYHMMPGLPGSSFDRDLKGFKTIFTDPRFKPDMIKIYPCLVLKGTKVYEWWKNGEYTPYSTEEAVDLLFQVKKIIPPWIRIMRIQRDIPAQLIEAGVKHSNLRQLVLQKLNQSDENCNCIRCREVGHKWLKDQFKTNPKSVELRVTTETASEGEELFISAEDPTTDVLLGYLRLRIPSTKAHRPEIEPDTSAIIRELRVCGPMVPVGKRRREGWQHKGYGTILLQEAEEISREIYDRNKIIITSALGTKRYYSRFGYNYDGPYVSRLV